MTDQTDFDSSSFISSLYLKQLKQELTEQEQAQLEAWRNANAASAAAIEAQLTGPQLLAGLQELKAARSYTDQQLMAAGVPLPTSIAASGRVRKMGWLRYAAAIILLIAAATTWLLLERKGTADPAGKGTTVIAANDVAPGGDRAILTLADGSTILLDSAANGTLAQQEGSAVRKLSNGQLEYVRTGASTRITYNKMTIPRGGQYRLNLSDGTKVWLNAESFIQYPTAFSGKDRVVKIGGEVYFEVADNKTKPFIVQVDQSEITVIGTQFNVKAYPDESGSYTTLVQGAIQLKTPQEKVMLQPGQQAQLLGNELHLLEQAPMEEVLAWKNNMFVFRRADIESIMKTLARWYNIEVVYKGKVDELFYARIPRNTPLSNALNALQLTDKVQFTIQGTTVTVSEK
ncbi:MAG: DUF4974 domain-containing protein [Candidatus Pseudobacter hemicellulosilyticus]|uniref:DUF4974 domain-containing protein n=1 Tax=Candidatus Pseudobacter hemicellulosilyticus TaxID=3121375 RepID=A0AAJ6BEU2_9BACT|nr:MAG: DUF4974 domain-containing protein [Pseudobacter sp.]